MKYTQFIDLVTKYLNCFDRWLITRNESDYVKLKELRSRLDQELKIMNWHRKKALESLDPSY